MNADTPDNAPIESSGKERSLPGELLNMPVKRAVFRLAWPAMIAGLLENLSSTVDMIMVGRLGVAEIASVGLCAMINWALGSLGMGLSVAVTAIVARHYGSGETEEARQGLACTLILAAVSSALLAIAIFGLAPMIIRFFGVEEDVYVLSVPYLRIIAFSGIFWTVIAVSSGALRGAGDVRTPLYIGLVKNIIHIPLNYVLIFGKLGFPALGVEGAALGTLLSSAAAMSMYLYLLHSGSLRLGLSRRDFRWDSQRVYRVFRIALPASVESFVLEGGLLIYAKFIVLFGTVALSGYQVGMQVLSLAFIPNQGFSTAAATLVGQNLGAFRKKEAKKAGWICLFFGTLSMSLVGGIGLFNARWISSIFIKDPAVIEVASAFVRIVAFSQPGMAVYFAITGALRGAGDTRSPLFVTIAGMYGIRITGAWIVTRLLGMGIEPTFSLVIFDYIVRVFAILWLYQRGKWMETRI